MGG
ncbi:hypothetical protein YPPY36_2381, partial [Yersinia pestis PY-36]|jgi:hypothetical protein